VIFAGKMIVIQTVDKKRKTTIARSLKEVLEKGKYQNIYNYDKFLQCKK